MGLAFPGQGHRWNWMSAHTPKSLSITSWVSPRWQRLQAPSLLHVLPPPALRELEGVIGFGKREETGKKERQSSFLSLWQTQLSFELSLGLSLAPSRGKGGKGDKPGCAISCRLGAKAMGLAAFLLV